MHVKIFLKKKANEKVIFALPFKSQGSTHFNDSTFDNVSEALFLCSFWQCHSVLWEK